MKTKKFNCFILVDEKKKPELFGTLLMIYTRRHKPYREESKLVPCEVTFKI